MSVRDTVKTLALGAAMFGTIIATMCFTAKARADEVAHRMVCPQPFDIKNRNFSRCHRVEQNKSISFNQNSGTSVDVMAEVCDATGHDCYTGYVSSSEF